MIIIKEGRTTLAPIIQCILYVLPIEAFVLGVYNEIRINIYIFFNNSKMVPKVSHWINELYKFLLYSFKCQNIYSTCAHLCTYIRMDVFTFMCQHSIVACSGTSDSHAKRRGNFICNIKYFLVNKITKRNICPLILPITRWKF